MSLALCTYIPPRPRFRSQHKTFSTELHLDASECQPFAPSGKEGVDGSFKEGRRTGKVRRPDVISNQFRPKPISHGLTTTELACYIPSHCSNLSTSHRVNNRKKTHPLAAFPSA